MTSEAEKYEVLERIGRLPHSLCRYRILGADLACRAKGQGSFGIIRKVRRKTDGLVSDHQNKCTLSLP